MVARNSWPTRRALKENSARNTPVTFARTESLLVVLKCTTTPVAKHYHCMAELSNEFYNSTGPRIAAARGATCSARGPQKGGPNLVPFVTTTRTSIDV